MKTTFAQGRARIARLSSLLVLATGSHLLGACAAAPSDAADPAELPAPGDVHVVQPIKLADRARVPEKEPGFVAAELGVHQLVITHDGSLPPFAEGDVLGGTQGGGYLVRVVSARALDATRVALETTPAYLTELISEGHFHVRYDAEEYARAIEEHLEHVRELGSEDGEEIASHADALKLAAGARLKLLDVSSKSLPASCGVTARGTAELDVTAELSPVLDLEVEIGAKGRLDPRPELKKLRFVAAGRLDVNAALRGAGTVTGTCTVDLLALAGGVPSVPLPTMTFWVGPVPVVITTEVAPKATADLGLSFSAAEISASARTTTELEAGVDYRNKRWSTIWEPSCDASGEATIAAPGAITASGKVSAGAELRARLYGVLGPNIGVQAYARVIADTAPPYCTYDARVDGGVRAYAEAKAGVSVGPLDLTLASLDLVDLELLRFDGPQISGALRDAPECRAEP